MASLNDSYRHCQSIASTQARNFYYSFLTLPRAKKQSMCAIYTWMRKLDDLADDAPSPDVARQQVHHFRLTTQSVLAGHIPADADDLLWPAFQHTVETYSIPHFHFHEIAEGALMDQEIQRYETFHDLYQYCYRVASVVGLVCLRIFQYQSSQAEKAGEWLGIAFQLTNILRDVREDAERGRIYLPLEELRKFNLSEEEVLQCRWSPAFHDMLQSFAHQTELYYEQSHSVFSLVSPDSRPTLKIMRDIYHGILIEIRNMDYQVLNQRARVPSWKKSAIVLKHLLRLG